MLLNILSRFLYMTRITFVGGIRRSFLSLTWKLGPGVKITGRVWRRAFSGEVSIGAKCTLGPDVCIDCSRGAQLIIGKNVAINAGTHIGSLKSITIADNVLIGEYCSIRDNDHAWRDPGQLIRDQGYVVRPVEIGSDVWIGRGAVISKGVTVGQGAIVGANAVVTHDVDPYTVVAGVPARIIARRQ